MIEIVGSVGSFLLAVCGIFPAIDAVKTRSGVGISWPFLITWWLGEVITLSYLFHKDNILPLLFNYGLNIVFISVIMVCKLIGQSNGRRNRCQL